MATRKQKGKGKGKVTASRESTNGGAGSSTRARGAGSSRAGGVGSSTRARVRTPSPSPPGSPATPPGSPASPPSTPPSPSSPRDPNRHTMTVAEERAWMGRKPRSNSMGKFGEKRPTKPTRVDIHGGRIFDDTAKKTLLSIMRDQWPVGLFTYTDIAAKNPRWMDDVLTEFGYFYKHLRGQSRFEATYSIEEHETGLPASDLRPSYLHPILWDELVKYWNTDAHKHKSEVGANNRKKVSTLHSAGAKSFEAIEMEMTKANKGKRPRRLQVWERTHTTSASRKAKEGNNGANLVYTSPGALAIASRYSAILEREGVDLSLGSEFIEPLDWWLQATTDGAHRPKKNRLIGYPCVPASTLLPNLAHRYRERTIGGAGSSSSVPNQTSRIPDPLFVQVVRNAVTTAQTNPGHFQRELNTGELESLARNLIEVSDPASRGNFNTMFFQEVVNIVSTVMTDICNIYEEGTRAAIEEANREFTDGESSENDVSGDEDDDGACGEEDNGDDGGHGAEDHSDAEM
ncbi:hypothetical protein POM88_031807 [Heracleum sosnowskyi]|uniref:Transposase n=1 Tax=Heracleum sosnowskyi TaxID=360622 RepID=A0AAD8HZC2_9APIA|nr:hypothetical protein POM88_031807 [Heracleum sosnowskyi]